MTRLTICSPRILAPTTASLLLAIATHYPAFATIEPQPRPPNIVYIIGDDLAFSNHGFLGDTIVRTPNLDKLARGGTVFTTGYATASVCRPSLESLLTGEEPIGRRTGERVIRTGEETLPGVLGNHGYTSMQTGKFWRNRASEEGFIQGTKDVEKDDGPAPVIRWMGGQEGLRIGRTTMEPIFDFILQHENQPFFIWFAPLLPHVPWNAPEPLHEIYRLHEPPLDPSTIAYYANTTWLDNAVGQLLDFLDKRGLRSNTLIVFFNDNGVGPRPEDRLAGKAWNGAKGTTAELGFRTPVVFNWPGHIPAGVVRKDLVSLLDLYPTVLGYAGVSETGKRPGFDLREAIAGGPGPRAEIIGRMAQVRFLDPQNLPPSAPTIAYFLRDDRWHYAWAPSENLEVLFDVRKDPQEQHNRAQSEPDVAQRLRTRIKEWIKEDRPQ